MPVWALVLSIAIAAVSQLGRVRNVAYLLGLLGTMWYHHCSQQYDHWTCKSGHRLGEIQLTSAECPHRIVRTRL